MLKYAYLLLGSAMLRRDLQFFAPDGETTAGGASPRPSTVDAPGAVGPGAARPDPNLDNQLRKQARAASQTLRAQAEAKAQDLSRATGKLVQPEVTATEEQLLEQLKGGGDVEHDTPLHRTAGPNPGTQALRPGESALGRATGKLATASPIPEHQVLGGGAGLIPTGNAPGLGSDTGLKLTADNPGARALGGGHAEGLDPADKGTLGDVKVAEVRHDTPEDSAKRNAAVGVLHTKVDAGDLPTREDFLAAGCPESQVDRAISGAQLEIDEHKRTAATVKENQAAAASTAGEKPAEPTGATGSTPEQKSEPAQAAGETKA